MLREYKHILLILQRRDEQICTSKERQFEKSFSENSGQLLLMPEVLMFLTS